MAWQRAKGELKSMLETYATGNCREKQHEEFSALADKFIKEVEDEGLQE
jgi:hypothetical protein